VKESYENMKVLLGNIQRKKIIVTFAAIQRSLLSRLTCSLAKQNFVALCVSGRVGIENIQKQ
jgi:hypothetical protein